MDSSVAPPCQYDDDYDGEIGIEIVSPIFDSLETLEVMVKELFDVLKTTDVYFDQRCGLHFHISHPDLRTGAGSNREFASIVMHMALLEYEIYKRLKYQGRLNRNYCQPLPTNLVLSALSFLSKPRVMDTPVNLSHDISSLFLGHVADTVSDKYGYDRYRGLNFHALWYRGALEFRYNEMTFEVNEFMKWIRLYNSIVYKALSHQYEPNIDVIMFPYEEDIPLVKTGSRTDSTYKVSRANQQLVTIALDSFKENYDINKHCILKGVV